MGQTARACNARNLVYERPAMRDTIELAREAGGDDWGLFKDFMPEIERLVALVRADEREACAKVCDSLEEQCEKLLVPDEKWPTPSDCAHIIRARGNA
jgi:hypothetical protein